ncbi:Os06g0616900 [Oryza sativa Japonica Group]|uniref:Os06g0616900 protein n=2 Tax=Oryza sativa subsp. japonica TaxID=39947 RepID=Q69U86_ORYSJ|nr:unknown protein [Oryza sativa Japonica Group]BAF19994.1 Os06g0616900 [Oryza sativa Japonica Group]BAG98202.1 unnamed protein product [Oryza sativa Japonica Group]BAS98629.1 Os06g0616900 [Oryza sativa Japonica Group]|eukprot:NP_001058080.1 Os06g0616900 [Oryza sativa Japonica Group]
MQERRHRHHPLSPSVRIWEGGVLLPPPPPPPPPPSPGLPPSGSGREGYCRRRHRPPLASLRSDLGETGTATAATSRGSHRHPSSPSPLRPDLGGRRREPCRVWMPPSPSVAVADPMPRRCRCRPRHHRSLMELRKRG